MLATRRKRDSRITDAVLLDGVRYLEALATKSELAPLGDTAQVHYEVPASESAVLTDMGIPLDELENVLMELAAYRQAARVLLPKLNDVKGRPLTPLHGGHVGLLCTAGMLNGVFGEGEDRHIAHWRSVKFTDHWEEEEEDGTKLLHDRERFSHELTLVFANGKTQVLTHEKKQSERRSANAHRSIYSVLDAALAALGTVSSNGTSRTMSAAARRRISLTQKARWAKQRTAKPKRTMSAAGRRRIAAAQRARWAKVKSAA